MPHPHALPEIPTHAAAMGEAAAGTTHGQQASESRVWEAVSEEK
jgi:hypothetical protein